MSLTSWELWSQKQIDPPASLCQRNGIRGIMTDPEGDCRHSLSGNHSNARVCPLRWLVAGAFCLGTASRLMSAQIAIPNPAAGEDSPFGGGTFVNKGWRLQFVYGAVEFAASTNALLITE